MKNLFKQADELLENTNNSPTGYEQDLQFDVSDFIFNKLKKLGNSHNWLAKKLHIKYSKLEEILCVSEKLDLTIIARIYWALGEKPMITIRKEI